MYCKYCGSLIEDGYKFCINCGKPVEEPPKQEKIGPVIPVTPVVPVPVPVRQQAQDTAPQMKAEPTQVYVQKNPPQEEMPKTDAGAEAYLEKQAQEAAQTLTSTVGYEMEEETGKVITAVGEEEKAKAAAVQPAPSPAPLQSEYTVLADPAVRPAPPARPVPPPPPAPAAQPVRQAPPAQPVYEQRQPAAPQPPVQPAAPQQPVYAQQPYVQQPYAQQPYAQQPYVQQPYVQQNDQYRYVPVQPAAPPVQVVQPVVVTPPVKVEAEKPGNGQAVAGIVFGVLAMIVLSISVALLSRFSSIDNMISMSGEELTGRALGGGFLLGFGTLLYVFNFIFGLIGFIKGLKHRSKMAAGIIAMVFIVINLILLISGYAVFPRLMAMAANV